MVPLLILSLWSCLCLHIVRGSPPASAVSIVNPNYQRVLNITNPASTFPPRDAHTLVILNGCAIVTGGVSRPSGGTITVYGWGS